MQFNVSRKKRSFPVRYVAFLRGDTQEKWPGNQFRTEVIFHFKKMNKIAFVIKAFTKSEKPRRRVSNADQKVFANLESFCLVSGILRKYLVPPEKIQKIRKCPDDPQQ